MVTKNCSKCGVAKDATEFYRRAAAKDGLQRWCKACHLGAVMAKYWADPGVKRKTAERNLARYHTDPVYRDKVKAAKKTAKYIEWKRKHNQTPAARELQRLYRERHRVKILARTAVKNAIGRGDIHKPLTCQHPGKYAPQCSGRIEGHHHKGYDPENWLEVEWLCRTCHTAADRRKT